MRLIERACWICSQPHNPNRHELHARLYGRRGVICKHREPEVELAIARAIEARERREEVTSGRRGKIVIRPDKRWIRMMKRRAKRVEARERREK